jgi:hypothetical protein
VFGGRPLEAFKEILMARLLGFDHSELVARTAPAVRAFQEQTLALWQDVFDALKLEEPVSRDSLPIEAAFRTSLTQHAMAHSKTHRFTGEPRPSHFYPHYDLPPEFKQSRTWQYLISDVFCQGEMPDDLWFMYDDISYVTTNWITPETMEPFLGLQSDETLIMRMTEAKCPVVSDVRKVTSLFRECLDAGWHAYLFDPST